MDKIFLFHPHHGLCLRFFAGRGYSPEFTKAMAEIQTHLTSQPKQKLCLTCGADVICAACPHNSNGVCESIQKVSQYDQAVLMLCSLEENACLSWSEFSSLVKERILAAGKFSDVCNSCEWFSICLSALEREALHGYLPLYDNTLCGIVEICQ